MALILPINPMCAECTSELRERFMSTISRKVHMEEETRRPLVQTRK